MDQAEAIQAVEARLKEIGEPGFTYTVIGTREHADVWAIAVQPYRPDGQPTYDYMGFDVVKLSGEVRHMI